jgi:pyruvate formate-lyase/glycerol dehydratase family glycyl radical enzyme
MRQARIFAHVLDHKRAIVRDDDLLLGTTTSQRVGVQIFPELGGTAIWPELLTVEARTLNPYEISPDDVRVLNEEVFPHWIQDNIREWTRARFGNPACLRLDERWVLYFLWKNHAISHTIADMPAVLQRGLRAMASEARERERDAGDASHRDFARAAALCLEAVIGYAARLAQAAEDRARTTVDPARRAELEQLAAVCRHAPAEPARTLHEALSAVWICFLALHQENMNAGLSIGRLDTWLQPYLERELAPLDDPEMRERAVRRALELVGAFLLKATDHLPLVADIGNRLFGGSSSDQVITLGGVKPDGSSAVCDMTYLLLKATELLALRDPNMNARYCPGTNPEPYLRRLCEVNLITGATPSLHNDRAVLAALERQGFPIEDARDWGATGCVEPTLCGRHLGHTNCMMFSMVAPLEMTLHDGVHPLLEEQVGPSTGDPLGFASYDELLTAYKRQLAELLDQAVEANNLLGEAHRALHPTPFLSALIQGPLDSGRDVTDGGARYNSSGVAMVGLADVVDSLAAIKTLLYDRRRVTMPQLRAALAADFVGHETLRAEILQRVPKFGSADPLPTAIAADLVDFVFDRLQARHNIRGGRYLPGYWSMSNHVAFGRLSGALPSGRLRGKPFTPGLTPSPLSQTVLLDNIRQVAALPAEKLPNNIAFNVKIAPGGADDHHQVVDRMTAYAKTYFDLGGMQLQFNVVSSAALRDAMDNPEAHRHLLVRISGYNAYFVELNRDMQLELIERVEHR